MLVLQSENLISPRIAHGFFGRQGGVSEGLFASLNCGPGSGDKRARVLENRCRVEAVLGAPLVTLYQVHSPNVVTVTEAWQIGAAPHADAMVTDRPGLALGILTADCAPILLADAEAGAIGAVHAGWKGALGGVIEAAVAAMEKLGTRRARIAAAIGPCISQVHYEVGPEFHAVFLAADPAHARFFVPSDRASHFRFDLEGFATLRLADAGVTNIDAHSACTYARRDDFFSFRRTTHAGEKDYGRQVSAIVLTD
jgi:hypothetical protein